MLSPSERRGLRREAEDIIDSVQESGRTSLTKAEQERFDTITETLDAERLREEVRSAKTISSGLEVTRDKKVYRSDERLSDRTPGSNDLSLDRMVRGMATGYWDGAEAERRAMGEGTDSAGGFLVPSPLANRIFDLARAESVCIAAGAQTVPMTSETLKYAKVNTDVSSGIGIVAENATISASDYVFGSETLTAFKLASRHEVSLELLEDGQGIESFIERSLAEQFALAVDSQLLSGGGSSAPLGHPQQWICELHHFRWNSLELLQVCPGSREGSRRQLLRPALTHHAPSRLRDLGPTGRHYWPANATPQVLRGSPSVPIDPDRDDRRRRIQRVQSGCRRLPRDARRHEIRSPDRSLSRER